MIKIIQIVEVVSIIEHPLVKIADNSYLNVDYDFNHVSLEKEN